ncbi:MAG: phage tail protein, partial [Geminicoccaceae bacterium]
VQRRVAELRAQARGILGQIADAIAAFVDDPAKFIIEGILKLLGISPAAFWAVVAKIEQVIDDIADDPLGFANNLALALKEGFQLFFDNIKQHLLQGFIDWLLSGLGAVGVEIPRDLSLTSLLKFFLQIMGITWPRIRAILVRLVGEQNVALIEQAWNLISTLIEQGPEGIVQLVKDALDPKRILDMVIEAAVDYLIEALITNVTARIIALFNPAGAIIQALELIYRVLKWVFENAARIFRLVETVVNGVADILAGNTSGMATAIESALAQLIPPVIDFLAGYIGLGNLPETIAEQVKKLQDWVESIIERVLRFLVDKGKQLLAAITGRSEEEGPEEAEGESAEDSELGTSVTFAGGGEVHRHWVEIQGTDAVLMVASDGPGPVAAKLAEWRGKLSEQFGSDDAGRQEAEGLLSSADALLGQADTEADALVTAFERANALRDEEAPEIPSDNTLEARQRALAPILRRLFELFGEKPDLRVIFADDLARIHPAAQTPVDAALDALAATDDLPGTWENVKTVAEGATRDVGDTKEAPLNQSHTFGATFAHDWATEAVMRAVRQAGSEAAGADDLTRRRINKVIAQRLGAKIENGRVVGLSAAAVGTYLSDHKAQVHAPSVPFDESPTPKTETYKTFWNRQSQRIASSRIRETFYNRVRMGAGSPPGPELDPFIRRGIWERLSTASLVVTGTTEIQVRVDAQTAGSIEAYLVGERELSGSDPKIQKSLEWWRFAILNPEWHHAWPQWLGGAFNQTKLFLPRALHNFDGIPTEEENFPGGFHQVFNGMFRSRFPVAINDEESWNIFAASHPEALSDLRQMLVESYKTVLERYGQNGQAAAETFIAGVQAEYNRLALPGS